MNRLFTAAMVGAAVLALAGTSYAQRGDGGARGQGHGGSGAWQGGGGSGSGWQGGRGAGAGRHDGGSGSGWQGGGRGSNWSGGGHGGGYRGHAYGGYRYGYRSGWYGWPYYSFGLAIGAPFGYWAPWYYPYWDVAYPYRVPVYPAPAVVYADPQPASYVQQDPGYRYYCPNPAGFYPDVPNCSTAWLKVVPDTRAPQATPGQTQ